MLAHCAEQPVENTVDTCKDGLDNDGNGYVDCADFSCSADGPPEIVDACLAKAENTADKCNDGVDNDDNGFVDCADYSCVNADNLSTRQACQESLALLDADADGRCMDGKDNDGDGFLDCDDWDCSHNPLVTVCADEPKVCEQP